MLTVVPEAVHAEPPSGANAAHLALAVGLQEWRRERRQWQRMGEELKHLVRAERKLSEAKTRIAR